MNKYIDSGILEAIHPTATPTDDASSALPDTLTIGLNGVNLLRVSADGTVTGNLEDMGIAAAVFVREVRKQIDFPARTNDRLVELLTRNSELVLENRILLDRSSPA